MNGVCDAVGRLENFPMTMGQLQDTRIGQLLQVIRHKVDPSLQKRIRFIIKSWQKLLTSDFNCPFVIPLKPNDSDNSSHTKQNCNIAKSHIRDKSKPPSDNTPTVCTSTNLLIPRISGFRATQDSAFVRPISHDSLSKQLTANEFLSNSDFPLNHSSTPAKRLKISPSTSIDSDATVDIASPSKMPLMNGNKSHQMLQANSLIEAKISSKPHSPTLPNVSGTSEPSRANSLKSHTVRLSKVKSTAELVQAAGDCIDSATADRILTNRISKEVDPPRQFMTTQPTKLRHRSIHQNNPRSLCGNQIDNGKSVSPEIKADSMESCPSLSKQRVTTPIDHAAIPLNDLSTTAATLNLNVEISPQSHLKSVTRNNSSIDVKKHKKKHKHHKSNQNSDHKSFDQRKYPSITNFLDDWPQLPPLPENIDWYSLDHSSSTCDNQTNEEGTVNSSQDNCVTFPTELHSVALNDQYLHILPWIDIVGYRRKFFPGSPNEELRRLTELPDPW